MIRIADLTVRYGSLVAVNRMSLEIPEGAIFGLIGPNGAGKTTTIKVLAGLLLPDEGSAEIEGHNVATERDAVRRRIGYMADFFGVYDYLTVYEYLAFFGGMYGLKDRRLDKRIDEMLTTVTLTVKKHSYVSTLSRGMKQRLYFARALIHDPQLLILDEPASGMDPRGRAELVQTLKALNARGKTVFISSHILSELQDLCTSIGIMETGRLVSAKPLKSAPAPTRRRVLVTVAKSDAERALALLEKRGEVSVLDKLEGRLLLETPDDDETVAEIARYLVGNNVRILFPRAEGLDLQEIFMKMTKGELM